MHATIHLLCRFSAALDALLAAPDAAAFEAAWQAGDVQPLAWRALAQARKATDATLAPTLAAVDRRLLAVLDRGRALLDAHITTFRVTEIERWQHAAAAALVNARWGVAGLRTVIADAVAPLGRRYFAFLTLAERHPTGAWSLFEKYLATPDAHHAFLAAAVEASRFYGRPAARALVALFDRIRGDQLLRRFLGPKILESLYALNDPAAVPLYHDLVVAGHTAADPDRCEVTRALVGLRRLTGRIADSTKFADPTEPAVRDALDAAERRFEDERETIHQVTVI